MKARKNAVKAARWEPLTLMPGWQHVSAVLAIGVFFNVVQLAVLYAFVPSGDAPVSEAGQQFSDIVTWATQLAAPLAIAALFVFLKKRFELADGIRLGVTYGVLEAAGFLLMGLGFLVGFLPFNFGLSNALKAIVVSSGHMSILFTGLFAFLASRNRGRAIAGGVAFFLSALLVEPFISLLLFNLPLSAEIWWTNAVQGFLGAFPAALFGVSLYAIYEPLRAHVSGRNDVEKVFMYGFGATIFLFFLAVMSAIFSTIVPVTAPTINQTLTGEWETALGAVLVMAFYECQREHA